MQLEVVRAIAEALLHPHTGLEAQLATLPIDTGDARPSGLHVVDGTKDDAVQTGDQLPRGTEILVLVTPDGPTLTVPEALRGGEWSVGTTPVACTVVHRGSRGPAEKAQDAEYVCRTITLALKAYFLDRDQTYRTRNEVRLLKAQGVTYGIVQDDGMGALGAVVFRVQSIDLRAQRAP